MNAINGQVNCDQYARSTIHHSVTILFLQVNGINYGAFAAAPALVNPMVTALVNPHNLSPSATPYVDKTEKYFTNAEVLDNFPKIYYFAIIGQLRFHVMVLLQHYHW